MRKTLALLPLCFLMISALACGGDENDGPRLEEVDTAKLVKVFTADECVNLDPHTTSNGGDTKVINQIYETLVRVDPSNYANLIPGLATKWTVSEDGKTITFTMREGVKFHDGSEFNAEAARKSIHRVGLSGMAESKYGSQYSMIESLEAGEKSLVVKTKIAAPEILLRNFSMFSSSIVSPKFLDEANAKGATYGKENASGTGPFKLSVFAKGKVTLEANADYWDGAPAIETIVFSQSADNKARLAALNGDAPVVVDAVPPSEWDALGERLKRWTALNCCYIGLNTNKSDSALNNLKVRRAIQLALDRGSIARLYDGSAKAAFTLLPSVMLGKYGDYKPEGWDDERAKRIELAKKLIQESGLSKEQLTIGLLYPRDARPYLPKPKQTANRIQTQLAEIGITITPDSMQNEAYFNSFPKEEHEIGLLGWMSDNGDPDNFFDPLTGAHMKDGALVPNKNNVGRTRSSAVNKDIQDAKSIRDTDARLKAYRDLEARQQRELIGYVPLVHTEQALAFTDSLSGLEVDGLGHYRFHKAAIK